VEEDFKKTFGDYFDKLYRYAFTIVQDNGEAKDIVQSAFVKLWEKRHEVESAKAYLYTSVYHFSLNAIRNRKVREGHHQRLASSVSTDSSVDTAEVKEVRHRINQVIGKLPPKCKEVFYSSRFEGKKYAEIAEAMDISIKTVEAQMGKALKILRENLADLIVVIPCCFLY